MTKRILNQIVSAAAIAIALCIHVPGAQAEFILTGPLSYHSNSSVAGAAGVTVLPVTDGANHRTGLIFYSTRDPIPAQLFHPRKLTAQRAESAFLEYSKETRTYSSITLPQGYRAAVAGNFSIRIGSLRVAVSTQSNQLPYVSVVHETEQPSILGILGNDVVVLANGRRSESWLDAGLRGNREMFEARGGQMYLDGLQYTEQRIGLPNQSSQESACLNRGTVVMNTSLFTEFLKGRMHSEVARRLETARSGPNDIQSRYTILNVLPAGVVALDGYGKPVVITQERERLANGENIVCTIGDLPS